MARTTFAGTGLPRAADCGDGHFIAVSVQSPYVRTANRGVELVQGKREPKMANTAIIRDAYGVPAIFVGSKTGRDDAPFVFVRVGGEERRMRWSEWDALPAWTGESPTWASKTK